MKDNPLKLIFALSLLLNFLVFTTVVYLYSQAKYSTSPIDYKFRNWPHPRDDLSLSVEQFRIMKEKLKSFHVGVDDKRQELIKKKIALINLLRSEKPDWKAIDTTIAQISTVQKDIERTVVLHILDGKGVLDKNQQQRFLDRLEEAMVKKRLTTGEYEYGRF